MTHIKRTWFRRNGRAKFHLEAEHGWTRCGLSTMPPYTIQQRDRLGRPPPLEERCLCCAWSEKTR